MKFRISHVGHFISFLLLAFSDHADAGGVGNSLLPKRFSAAVGYGVRPRDFFAQERFYQESWLLAGAAHWSCGFAFCEIIARTALRGFAGLPESQGQIDITTTESNVSGELGIESTAFVPVGVSLGLVRSKSERNLKTGGLVADQSSSPRWSEITRAPMFRSWIGVTLFPDQLSLQLAMAHLFAADKLVDKDIYSTELRYEF